MSYTLKRRLFLAWTLWMWLAWLFSGEFARIFTMAPLVPYFLLPPWPQLASSARAGILALTGVFLILASSLFSGGAILALIFRSFRRDPAEQPRPRFAGGAQLIRLAAGLPVLALAVQALGLCGLLFPAILTGLIVALSLALAVSGIHDCRRRKERSIRPAGTPPEEVGSGETGRAEFLVLNLICVLSAVSVVLATLAPEVAWDAVVYHLRVPTLYLCRHKVYPIPEIFPSYFPFSGQMLLLLGKHFGGDQGARLLHAAVWAACALAVARIARAVLGPRAAPWAMALFMTLPVASTIAARAYVEFFLLLPVACTVLVLVRRRVPALPVVALAGWLAGSVLGTKYLGGFITLIFLAIVMARTFSRPLPAVVFCLSSAAVSGLWFFRNYFLTGNPVFPVFFGGIHWTPADAQGWQADASAFVLNPIVLLTTPWTLLSAKPADGGISPMLLAAAPVPLLWPQATRGNRMIWGLSLALLLVWWATSPLPRYLLPALALLCVAASGAIAGYGMGKSVEIALKSLAMAGLIGSLACGISSIHYGTEPYAAALGKITGTEYRARRFGPTGFVETLSLAGQMAAPEERVYMLGHMFSYDLPRRVWFDFLYLRPALFWWLKDAPTAERVRIRAKQAGLRIIAHSRTGGIWITGERGALMDWTPVKLEAYMRFWTRHAERVRSIGDWDIYRITRKPGKFPLPAGQMPGAEGITVPIDHELAKGNFEAALRLAREAAARYPFFPYATERLRRISACSGQ